MKIKKLPEMLWEFFFDTFINPVCEDRKYQ